MSQKIKTKLDFNFIFEKILSLDTQKKISKSHLIKTAIKKNKFKKLSYISIIICLYYSKRNHTNDKCYYKYFKQAKKRF